MNINKIHTKKNLENVLIKDKKKLDFAIRQVVKLAEMLGIDTISQKMEGYEIIINFKNEKDFNDQ